MARGRGGGRAQQKLEQAERLGIGMGKQTTNSHVFSHSSQGGMQEVNQDEDAVSGSFLDRDRG